MKASFLIVMFVLFSWSATAAPRSTEQQVVSYAKALDVAKLDPSLPSQRLDEWLRTGPAHLDTVKWEMSNCDLKPVSADPNFVAPLCAKVRFMRGSVGGWAIITVGTFRTGIGGAPHLDHILVASKNGGAPDSTKLSELPRLLDEVSMLKDGR
jgi:hypothetical protein